MLRITALSGGSADLPYRLVYKTHFLAPKLNIKRRGASFTLELIYYIFNEPWYLGGASCTRDGMRAKATEAQSQMVKNSAPWLGDHTAKVRNREQQLWCADTCALCLSDFSQQNVGSLAAASSVGLRRR